MAHSEGISSGNHPSLGLAFTRGYARALPVYPGRGVTHYHVTCYAERGSAFRHAQGGKKKRKEMKRKEVKSQTPKRRLKEWVEERERGTREEDERARGRKKTKKKTR